MIPISNLPLTKGESGFSSSFFSILLFDDIAFLGIIGFVSSNILLLDDIAFLGIIGFISFSILLLDNIAFLGTTGIILVLGIILRLGGDSSSSSDSLSTCGIGFGLVNVGLTILGVSSSSDSLSTFGTGL